MRPVWANSALACGGRQREAWPATDSQLARHWPDGLMTKTELIQRAREIWALIDWADVGQIVIEGVVITAIFTFMAGRGLGRWMHRLNDQLAADWVRIWVGAPAAPTAARSRGAVLLLPAARPPAGLLMPAPVIAPAGPTAEQLMALTVRELMTLTGCRRKLSKRALVEIAMA